MSEFRNTHGVGSPKLRAGLPSRENLISLADTYCTLQLSLWNDADVRCLLQESPDEIKARMADAFTRAYLSGEPVDPEWPTLEGTGKGSCYLRFSDDNSNPRSLNQQLENVLKRARQDGAWIPWEYVFADAAIPGTTHLRPGYQLSKSIATNGSVVEVIYVDELSRLGRDHVESLTFAKYAQAAGTKLVGVVDGFDSAEPMAELIHSVSALRHQAFSTDLAAKVIRGERDAFNQGRNTGAIPMGYKLENVFDANGNIVVNAKGRVVTNVIIDDAAASLVRRIFEMYAHDCLSPQQIAKRLNDESALGKDNWGQSTIRQMLKNERYRGRVRWGRFANEIDPRTGRKKVVRRPEDEVLERQDEPMRIVSEDLWTAAAERMKEASVYAKPTKGSPSRQSIYPTRLFDLYCKKCKKPLRLFKSGTYPQLYCDYGKHRANGCTLAASKTLRIIDECLLAPIKAQVFDEATIDFVLKAANAYIIEEAAKPKTDVAATEKTIRSLKTKINKLVDRMTKLDEGPASDAIFKQIQKLEADLKSLSTELALAKKGNERPHPIDRESLMLLLNELRTLLNEDASAAHAILAKMVGRVDVIIGEKRGRTHTWIAEFSLNPLLGLIEIARDRSCPSTHSLEYLLVRSWTIDWPMTAPIFEVKREHRIAAKALEMFNQGTSKLVIQNHLNTDARTVKAALEFAKASPEEARLYACDDGPRPTSRIPKYQAISDEALELSQTLSAPKIAAQLGVSVATVMRAIDFAKQRSADELIELGNDVGRTKTYPLPDEKYAEIERRLRAGEGIRSVARNCGVDRSVVRRIHRTVINKPE